MTLFYNKVQRRNLRNESSQKLWHLVLKSIGKINEKEMAKEIAPETTLSTTQVENILYLFQKTVIRSLINGKIIQLRDLGTFQLTANSRGCANKEEADDKLIKKVNIRFLPSSSLKQLLNNNAITFSAYSENLQSNNRQKKATE